jgi:predicted DsbA family dithiol-disulfide isomerase
MTKTLQIDFVSDVSCPWCAVGLSALERALENTAGEVRAELRFQPFELNPGMAPGGEEIGEHLARKYGSTPDQQAAIRETIRQRGEGVGFTFRMEGRSRIYNTFDAHRLLHWAEVEGEPGQQHALKKAFLTAYFTEGQSPESHDVLLSAVRAVGLDEVRAAAILASDEFADEVREREQAVLQAGIRSVPAIIFNQRHLISGGQPVEVFERALRELAQAEG